MNCKKTVQMQGAKTLKSYTTFYRVTDQELETIIQGLELLNTEKAKKILEQLKGLINANN